METGAVTERPGKSVMRLGSRGGIVGAGPGGGPSAGRRGSGLGGSSEKARICGSDMSDGPPRIGQASGMVRRP